ncbi:hypothetical protein L6452_06087 [Arctium lappa]|uniref:Uncharacterized protein n=1 Tax=Arctium lappa TaxID=4217 RepID=A0ACB9EI83_ARCLA|nr:hypothetical protein L6452_06087 [Arctium lappa]
MEIASLNNGTRCYVMAVTPTRLYSFTGIRLLESSLLTHCMSLTADTLLSDAYASWRFRKVTNLKQVKDMMSIEYSCLGQGTGRQTRGGLTSFQPSKKLLLLFVSILNFVSLVEQPPKRLYHIEMSIRFPPMVFSYGQVINLLQISSCLMHMKLLSQDDQKGLEPKKVDSCNDVLFK